MTQSVAPADLYVPPFVDITFMGSHNGADEYTVSNEAIGRHFSANRPTIEFIEAIRASGALQHAMAQARLSADAAQTLLAQLMRFGVVVERGKTNQDAAEAQTPLESRAIVIRFDLFDASRITKRFAAFGRVLFSPVGGVIWVCLAALAVASLLMHQDKLALALSRLPDFTFGSVVAFLALLVVLKVLHEMGHALAYQEMCRRAGIAPGPIRMGLSIFALTPFPFTDVTGAWRLRHRVPRAIIGAGGLYLEFFFIFLATLFWAFTGEGWLQTAVFQVVMFSALSSLLFNLNPAVKLDGYYILSDLLALPNLAGRASQAAQQWFGRRLGADMPPPAPGLLAYWLLSYGYRWVIFAGIFWLAYQFDPRLAVPVFGIVLVMLVARPLVRSVQHALKRSARPTRMVTAATCLGAALIAGLVPFKDRVLLDGSLNRYQTTFIYAPEVAKLTLQDNGLPQLESLDLQHQQIDLALQREIIQNANRAVSQVQSGAERARLQTDLTQISQMQDNLVARAQSLNITTEAVDVWTPFAADDYADAWVTPNQGVLGAVSRPVPAHLVLWMDQTDFEVGLLAHGQGALTVRLTHDPDCAFPATLERTDEQLALQGTAIQLRAQLGQNVPDCVNEAPSGAALVARHPARSKSLAERAWIAVQRALQDRLPVETLLETENTR